MNRALHHPELPSLKRQGVEGDSKTTRRCRSEGDEVRRPCWNYARNREITG